MSATEITATYHDKATPAELFAVLRDPGNHPRIDGSGMVVAAIGDAP